MFALSILCKAKRSYLENLDIKNLNDNRKFYSTVKPLFIHKVRSIDYIALNENDLIIRNQYKIANIFNTFLDPFLLLLEKKLISLN